MPTPSNGEVPKCHPRILQAYIRRETAPGKPRLPNGGRDIEAFTGRSVGSGAILATRRRLRTGVDKKMTQSVFLTNIEEYEPWRALRTRLRNQPKKN